MTKIPVFIGPLVPYPYAVILKIFHIRITVEKPKQFMNNRLQMQLFCSYDRKSLFKVKAHLVAKHTFRSCSGSVFARSSMLNHMMQKINISVSYTHLRAHETRHDL